MADLSPEIAADVPAAAAAAGQDRATAAAPAPSAAGQSPPAAATGAGPDRATADSLDGLPRYARSLLRIEVPVTVELATKKQSVAEVLQLCPGAIIRFDKSCEETLELNVGGCTVAEGEAVKVGDKFGLRISSMVLPEERFRAVQRDARQDR